MCQDQLPLPQVRPATLQSSSGTAGLFLLLYPLFTKWSIYQITYHFVQHVRTKTSFTSYFQKETNAHSGSHTIPQVRTSSLNVECRLKAISNHGLFHTAEENNGLWNFLQSQKASSEQAHDLLKLTRLDMKLSFSVNY